MSFNDNIFDIFLHLIVCIKPFKSLLHAEKRFVKCTEISALIFATIARNIIYYFAFQSMIQNIPVT